MAEHKKRRMEIPVIRRNDYGTERIFFARPEDDTAWFRLTRRKTILPGDWDALSQLTGCEVKPKFVEVWGKE